MSARPIQHLQRRAAVGVPVIPLEPEAVPALAGQPLSEWRRGLSSSPPLLRRLLQEREASQSRLQRCDLHRLLPSLDDQLLAPALGALPGSRPVARAGG
eukprot:5461975-Pyramimonas_sp.AAC.2